VEFTEREAQGQYEIFSLLFGPIRGTLFVYKGSFFDELVKSRNSIEFVIPAKAGIQLFQDILDPGFRRGDAPRDFLRDHHSLVQGDVMVSGVSPSNPNGLLCRGA
jgi:hypothetical protein